MVISPLVPKKRPVFSPLGPARRQDGPPRVPGGSGRCLRTPGAGLASGVGGEGWCVWRALALGDQRIITHSDGGRGSRVSIATPDASESLEAAVGRRAGRARPANDKDGGDAQGGVHAGRGLGAGGGLGKFRSGVLGGGGGRGPAVGLPAEGRRRAAVRAVLRSANRGPRLRAAAAGRRGWPGPHEGCVLARSHRLPPSLHRAHQQLLRVVAVTYVEGLCLDSGRGDPKAGQSLTLEECDPSRAGEQHFKLEGAAGARKIVHGKTGASNS